MTWFDDGGIGDLRKMDLIRIVKQTIADYFSDASAVTDDDQRLADDRYPLPHGDTHMDGGADPVGTTVPTPFAIPYADNTGSLDAWVTAGSGTYPGSYPIVDADVSATAAIGWSKLSKVGSSLADLITRSAADLTSGILPLARLSGITDAQVAAANKDGAAGTASMRTLGTTATTAAAGNDARFTDARTPTAHAASHKHGGTDEVSTATAAANAIPKSDASSKLDTWISDATTTVKGKAELATDGENAANVVVQGNDSRLSNARTPTAHAASHASGGTDAVTLAESQVTNLVSDLALKAPLASPTFTGTLSLQQLKGTSTTTAQISANTNDYNPTNLATTTILVIDQTAAWTVTGLAGGAAGRVLWVNNASSFDLTLAHNSASSAAANRFFFPGGVNMVLPSGAGVMLVYYGGNLWLPAGNDRTLFGTKFGYTPGIGGAISQLTSRVTGVTLNKLSGAITLFSAAGSATWSTFTVTNSTVVANDVIVVSQQTGANTYNAIVSGVAAGSFKISVSSVVGTATEAPIINFAVIRAVNA